MIKNKYMNMSAQDNLTHKSYNIVASSIVSMLAISPSVAATQPTFSGGFTATYQATKDGRIDNEITASADLVITWKLENDELYSYIEANNSPKSNAISSHVPEANADAGSALDKDLDGRVQISEIGYRHFINKSQMLIFGLIDVTAYFDQSRIASDENSQFIGVSFVQNPTIEFPDYTLGVVYENALNQNITMRAALTASHGIADNPNVSYAQLVDVDDEDRGIFSILSLTHTIKQWLFRGGIWTHTAPHNSIDGSRDNLKNYGSYFLSGYKKDNHGINLRLGQSNERVSLAQRFAGLSYQYRQSPFVFGVAAARIFTSDDNPASTDDDTVHYEAYLRYRINQRFFITADIQQLINSNFDTSDTLNDHRQALYGLRLSYIVE